MFGEKKSNACAKNTTFTWRREREDMGLLLYKVSGFLYEIKKKKQMRLMSAYSLSRSMYVL